MPARFLPAIRSQACGKVRSNIIWRTSSSFTLKPHSQLNELERLAFALYPRNQDAFARAANRRAGCCFAGGDHAFDALCAKVFRKQARAFANGNNVSLRHHGSTCRPSASLAQSNARKPKSRP